MNNNVIWSEPTVTKDQRRELTGNHSFVIWLTGLSGAGKSTLAKALDQRLYSMGLHTYLLDGDNLRTGLNANLGFSAEDRQENVRRVAEVAKLFVDSGVIVLAALISPYKEDRERARALFEDNEFVEIFVDCPLQVCKQRDPKGLYSKAESGQIANITGIDAPYEAPDQPELVIHTDEGSIHKSVEEILGFLRSHGYFNA